VISGGKERIRFASPIGRPSGRVDHLHFRNDREPQRRRPHHAEFREPRREVLTGYDSAKKTYARVFSLQHSFESRPDPPPLSRERRSTYIDELWQRSSPPPQKGQSLLVGCRSVGSLKRRVLTVSPKKSTNWRTWSPFHRCNTSADEMVSTSGPCFLPITWLWRKDPLPDQRRLGLDESTEDPAGSGSIERSYGLTRRLRCHVLRPDERVVPGSVVTASGVESGSTTPIGGDGEIIARGERDGRLLRNEEAEPPGGVEREVAFTPATCASTRR